MNQQRLARAILVVVPISMGWCTRGLEGALTFAAIMALFWAFCVVRP